MTTATTERDSYPGLDGRRWRLRVDHYFVRRRLPLLGWRIGGLVELPGMTLVGHAVDGGCDQRGDYFHLVFDRPGGGYMDGGSVRVYYRDVDPRSIQPTTLFEASIAPPARRRGGGWDAGGDQLVCPCGNRDRFSPCDPRGGPVEPTATVTGPRCTRTWAAPLYVYAACGRVLHDELLVVVDRTRQPQPDPFDPATATAGRLVMRPRAPHPGRFPS
jgi:hypothetical protein